LHYLNIYAILMHKVGGSWSAKKSKADINKFFGRREKLVLLLERSDRQENILLRQLESGREKSLDVRLTLSFSKASDLDN
jgi:hypothetical protein